MSSRDLAVRPIVSEERGRFDEMLEAQHWLGAGLVGEVMRYVAVEDGVWCALVGFGSAALCVRSREELIGWSDRPASSPAALCHQQPAILRS